MYFSLCVRYGKISSSIASMKISAVVEAQGRQSGDGRPSQRRNAAPDSGKEEQGSCGQAGGKTDRAAEKSRIEA
jgi:hypothetical protein